MGLNTFQCRLKDWRIENGMSQEFLAELLKVSTRTLQNWEAGSALPSVLSLVALADLMGVSLDFLYGRNAEVSSVTAFSPRTTPWKSSGQHTCF